MISLPCTLVFPHFILFKSFKLKIDLSKLLPTKSTSSFSWRKLLFSIQFTFQRTTKKKQRSFACKNFVKLSSNPWLHPFFCALFSTVCFITQNFIHGTFHLSRPLEISCQVENCVINYLGREKNIYSGNLIAREFVLALLLFSPRVKKCKKNWKHTKVFQDEVCVNRKHYDIRFIN